jgi:uncharacterized phage protein (predicted DNA packaging)
MVSKVSEITILDVAQYIRVDPHYEESDIETYLNIAKNYISSYTGIPVTSEDGESLDDFPDFVIVVYVLCQDMYDNRALYSDYKSATVNKVVQTILDMHTRNYL